MDIKKHPHLPVFLLLSVVFIGFIIFASYLYHRQNNDDSIVKVKLKWTHNAQFAGFYVAEKNNYYKDLGLTVEFIEADDENRPKIESILNGEADFAIVSPLELLDYIAKDTPVKAVAAIYQESPTVIVSLPESGINGPADLRNKVLGTSRTENFTFSLYKFLIAKYKVPANSLDYKNIGFNALDELLSKRVDAVSMYRTQLFLPEGYPDPGFNLIKPEDHGVHTYNDVIVASNRLIEDEPELVKNFVHATIKGWDMALDYPDEAVETTMNYTKKRENDAKYEKFVISSSAPLIRPDGIKSVGQMKASRWLEIYHLFKSSVISPEFDVSKAYTIDFLP